MTIKQEAYLGKPISAFIVDAHTHISPYYLNGWYQNPDRISNSSVIEIIDRLGIDCIVTAPHSIILGMMTYANEIAAAAVKEYPGRIYGYISICPVEGLSAVKAQLKKYGKHTGFLGFKFLPGYHGSLGQPEYQYAADFANEASCPVLIHTWANDPPLAEVRKLAEARPHMKLLCAHQGGGSAELSRKLANIMKQQPNIYMEICGSLSNTMALEDLVEIAGEDHVIYGSDMINLDPRYDLGRVVFAPLPDSIKKKLLSQNFLSLLDTSQMGKIKKTN